MAKTKQAAPPKAPPTIADRIVGFGRKPADQFLANPHNWRIHPEAQRQALKGVLDSIGFAAPVVGGHVGWS